MAYTVSERARELGVRVALGATTSDVMRMVLAEAFALAAAGVVLRVAGAAAMTRWIASLLFGVTPTDPATFVSIAGNSDRDRARRQLRPGAARDEGRSDFDATLGIRLLSAAYKR